MKEIAIKAYNYTEAQAKASQPTEEENKQAGTAEEEQAKLVIKVDKIVDSLTTARKPAAKKGGFRSFMKTAKTELKQMNPEGGMDFASGTQGGAASAEVGFAATMALPTT